MLDRRSLILLLALAGTAAASSLAAETYDPGLFGELRWRMIADRRGPGTSTPG